MYNPNWFRVFLAQLNCSSVVLDAVWVCAVLDPKVTRRMVCAQANFKVCIVKPKSGPTVFERNCWTCLEKCPNGDYTCIERKNVIIKQNGQKFYDCHPAITPSTFKPIPLHPGVWLQRALALART
jgi:hypothetical protein